MKTLLAMLVVLIVSCSVYGQSKQPPLCRYKAIAPLPLRAEPSANAVKVGTLPNDKWFQALDKKSYWVKLNVKGIAGWASAAGMTRADDCPRIHHLEFHSNGYKIISGVYRNFFGIYNAGTASYAGKLTIRLIKDSKTVFEKTVNLSDSPIVESGGTSFHIDTEVKIDRYEFVTDDGKFQGDIGNLIEVIP